ncbi:hypothetical protein COCOBI_05-5050 [Coccomyxa sp. Obi]|nr:hypothetical protein COCOBI_05-5050 [Coccomyxa sp. Obi]
MMHAITVAANKEMAAPSDANIKRDPMKDVSNTFPVAKKAATLMDAAMDRPRRTGPASTPVRRKNAEAISQASRLARERLLHVKAMQFIVAVEQYAIANKTAPLLDMLAYK